MFAARTVAMICAFGRVGESVLCPCCAPVRLGALGCCVGLCAQVMPVCAGVVPLRGVPVGRACLRLCGFLVWCACGR